MTKNQMTASKALQSFLPAFVVMMILLLSGIDIFIALMIAMAIIVIYSLAIGFKWEYLEQALLNGAKSVLPGSVVIILVGALIGVWIACGSVPAMLYYGLKLINPQFFLPIAFILCCITSMATGTCWGTAGTMGVALIGMAAAIGVPLPMAAGAIISGAHFGDKLSPLSDTTVLASTTAKVNLYDHIVSMLYDTVPITVICLVVYTILGFRYGSSSATLDEVNVLMSGLKDLFQINVFMLIPPLVTIVLSVKRVPAIAVFSSSIFLAIAWAMIFQGVNLGEVCNIAISGFVCESNVASLSSLLSRGGTTSMVTSVYTALICGMFSGLLGETGVFEALVGALKKIVKTGRGLTTMTTFTCIFLMVSGGSQYTALTLPGAALHDAYEEYDVHPCVLSRTMENSGTLIGSIIPWDVSAVFLASTLGVSLGEYWCYALLPLLSPVMGLINGWFGIGVFHKNDRVRLTLKRRDYSQEKTQH